MDAAQVGGTPAAGPTSDQAAELADLVHAVLHGLRREAAAAGDLGLPPGQLRFLRMLDRCGGDARPGELAARLDLAPRSITTKVDLAEAAGLVARRPDPADRRATLVGLTAAGRDVLDRFAAERSRGASARLARLAPADRERLLAMLRRLAEPVRDEPPARPAPARPAPRDHHPVARPRPVAGGR